MPGRPKIFNKEAVIELAIEVFWKKGYKASSAEDLLKAMKIGEGSFYHTFKGGKRELFEKSLEQFSEMALAKFNLDFQKAENPIEFLRSFFFSLIDTSKERKMKGCYLGNAIVEMSNQDNLLKNKAGKFLLKLEERFIIIIEHAQKDGLIKNKTSAKIIARHLINLWNGINISQRMNGMEDGLKEVVELNLSCLK